MQLSGNRTRDLPEGEKEALTFPIVLTNESAWLLATLITPGPLMEGVADKVTRALLTLGKELRQKINRAVLAFYDEKERETYEIRFNEIEAWLLDQAVRFDGPDGVGTSILIQLYRGLVGMEMGTPLGFKKGMDDYPKEVVKDLMKTIVDRDRIPGKRT